MTSTYQTTSPLTPPVNYTTFQPGHFPLAFSSNPSPLVPGVVPAYVAGVPPAPPKPEPAVPPPTVPAVTSAVASKAIERLTSYELKAAGFGVAEPLAFRRIEFEVVAIVEQLYQRAHEYANLANRAGPIATDLLLACRDYGLQPKALRRIFSKSRKRKLQEVADFKQPVLVPPRSRSPSPELLPSDDEELPVIPYTLRALPSCFPSLPPKHTYLRTPVSPPKKAALPSLEKKLKTASLVQESLRNLMLATEDTSGQEDAELLGYIVNWEAGVHPRKRWKVTPGAVQTR